MQPRRRTLQFTCNLNIIINVGNTLLAGDGQRHHRRRHRHDLERAVRGHADPRGWQLQHDEPGLGERFSQFTFSATAACAAGTTVVIQETLQATGAGGGPLFQNIDSTFNPAGRDPGR
ncbi:MAG: hypothetical protein U0531_11530 [Dehalococcoidia bacterium]